MQILKRVTEQISTAWSWGFGLNGSLRSVFRVNSWKWWNDRPAMDKTIVNYNMARSLYRNDDPNVYLGSGFCKAIVDLPVGFMGLPEVDVENETTADFLNTAVDSYWAPQLQEMFRNAMRDSKTVVRIRRADPSDPLASADDIQFGTLEIIDPERVRIYKAPSSAVPERAVITHYVEMVDFSTLDAATAAEPLVSEHKVQEWITKEEYRYYDETDHRWLEEWSLGNSWGFIPLVEVYNEYDSALGGGQSDLESPLPFIRAFHDVLSQSLLAHKYHSVPKTFFKLNDVQTFLKNNFPDSFDSNGEFSGTVTWKGKEILFLASDEDAGFIEAKSVLGDSKTLLEFLFDCICVASETPEWAFMRVEAATQGGINAQTYPFEQKINRKRISFNEPIQTLLKMLLSINGMGVITPELTWQTTREAEVVARTQAFQQLVTGLEIAAQRQIISDSTYREALRIFLPTMKNPTEEARDAQGNFQIPSPATVAPNAGGQNE